MGLLRKAVGFGAAVVAALAVRRVLRRERPLSRRERLRQAYAEAAADPAYQAEMAEIDRAFDVTVGDGLTEAAAVQA